MKRLYTTDAKAVNHVLMNNYIYQKPKTARYHLSQILGNGVLVVEEDKHKQQVDNSIITISPCLTICPSFKRKIMACLPQY